MEGVIERTKLSKETSQGSYGAVSNTDEDEQKGDARPGTKLVRRITHRQSMANKLVRRRSVDGFYHGQPVPESANDDVDLNGAGNTVFLMVNTMIGAGILNMPQVFSEAGLGLGLAMFTVTMWANWMGLVMLVRVGEEVDVLDYGALAEHTFGTKGKFAVDGMIVASGYGALLSYFITIGKLGSEVLQLYADESVYTSYHFVLSVVTIFVILPICMIREFGHLVCISILSVTAIAGVVLLVLFHGPSVGAELGEQVATADIMWASIGGLRKFGAITFALGCAHSTFHAYRSLSRQVREPPWPQQHLNSTLDPHTPQHLTLVVFA
jgi:hypothetical protein